MPKASSYDPPSTAYITLEAVLSFPIPEMRGEEKTVKHLRDEAK